METQRVNAYEIIRKKRDGGVLAENEIGELLSGCLSGAVPEYQAAAFLMAVVLRGMTLGETAALTRRMLASGRTLRFDDLPGPLVDKHSTGGVGDKTSIALVPIAAACGLFVPMISGRSLGHTGGTLDKLDAVPGLKTALDAGTISRQVASLGGCFAAQTDDIVPADRMLYALRDATATVESVPLIVSSILSKKLAEGISGVVIDVKCGRGAFMETAAEARGLADALEEVGAAMGALVRTLVTAMDNPLGAAVGNALEIVEAVRILMGNGPADATALTLRLAAEMLVIGKRAASISEGEALAGRAVHSGRALERFIRIVEAQGGAIDPAAPRFGLPAAPAVLVVECPGTGWLSGVDARIVGEVVRDLGGGRLRAGDTVNPAVGVLLLKRPGDAIEAGEPLFEIHAADPGAAAAAGPRIAAAADISPAPVPPRPLVFD